MASSPPLLTLGNLPCQLHPDIPVLNTTLNRESSAFILEFMVSCQVVSSLWLALRCLMYLGALSVAQGTLLACLSLYNLSLTP